MVSDNRSQSELLMLCGKFAFRMIIILVHDAHCKINKLIHTNHNNDVYFRGRWTMSIDRGITKFESKNGKNIH